MTGSASVSVSVRDTNDAPGAADDLLRAPAGRGVDLRRAAGADVRAVCWGVLVLVLSACSGGVEPAVIGDETSAPDAPALQPPEGGDVESAESSKGTSAADVPAVQPPERGADVPRVTEYGLYVIDLGDGSVEVLVEHYAGVEFQFSPDRSKVAYSASNKLAMVPDEFVTWPGGLFVADSDGGNRVRLTDEKVHRDRAWSSDGSRLLYVSEEGLFLVSLDDYSQTHLSEATPHTMVLSEGGNVLHSDGEEWAVSAGDGTGTRHIAKLTERHRRRGWSVNGQPPTHIAFHSAEGFMLSAIDGGGAPLRLTGSADEIRWSRDGTRLMYTVDGKLRMVDPVAGRQVTVNSAPRLSWSAWSHDGDLISYYAADGDSGRLYVSRPDGSDKRVVSSIAPDTFQGAWWLPHSRKIVYGASARGVSRGEPRPDPPLDVSLYGVWRHEVPLDVSLWVYDLDTGTAGLLTRSWNGWLHWSPDGERVLYRSAGGLFITDSRGDAHTRIGARDAESVRWSPDGVGLVFRDAEGPFMVNADTGDKKPISQEPVSFEEWSHDSSRFAYTDEGAFVIDADTGTSTHLAIVPVDVSGESLWWIPGDTGLILEVWPSGDECVPGKYSFCK